jgi:hypothetical protein
MAMTGIDGDDELIGELRRRLIGEGLADGLNLLVRAENGVVQVHVMAVELGRLGMLLAALSCEADLQHPGSLSRRLAPGDNDGGDGRWQYELVAGRYPHSNEIVFSVLIRMPASDVPEILLRLA